MESLIEYAELHSLDQKFIDSLKKSIYEFNEGIIELDEAPNVYCLDCAIKIIKKSKSFPPSDWGLNVFGGIAVIWNYENMMAMIECNNDGSLLCSMNIFNNNKKPKICWGSNCDIDKLIKYIMDFNSNI